MRKIEFHLNYFRVNNKAGITYAVGFNTANGNRAEWCKIGDCTDVKEANLGIWGLHNSSEHIKAAMRNHLAQFEKFWLACLDWTEDKEWLPIDVECVAEMLNPDGGGPSMTGNAGIASMFIREILEYPRFLTGYHNLRVGGMEFLCPNSKKPRVGDAIDEAISHFKAWVAWIGRRCGCKGKAQEVIGKCGNIYNWICFEKDITPNVIDGLTGLVKDAYDALHAMSIAVADSTPTKKPGRGAANDGGPMSRKPRLDVSSTMQEFIYKTWVEYKEGDAPIEVNGEQRKAGGKRNYAEFLDLCGTERLNGNGKSINEVVGEDVEKLKKVIHNYRRRIKA